MKLVLAGDLGGTHFRAALVDETGRIRASRSERLPVPRSKDDVLLTMLRVFEDLRDAAPSRPRGVSLSIKGRVDEKRGLSLAMIMTPGWIDVPLVSILRRELGLPVYLENDARCAAVGEGWKGRGKGKNDFVFVIVGTGIGTGTIRDGKLWRGASGHAGEFGHIVIDDSDRELICACGEFGHWEALAAGPSMAFRARRLIDEGIKDLTGYLNKDPGPVDGAWVHAAMREGVKSAKAIIEEAGRRLGTGLYNVVRAEDPSLIVLGGGVSRMGKPLLDPARRECAARLGVFGIACPPIVASSLGDDAGLLGAARRALDPSIDSAPSQR